MRCEYHNDHTTAKKVSCGVWSMNPASKEFHWVINTVTSASKEFSWVINLCLVLLFPS